MYNLQFRKLTRDDLELACGLEQRVSEEFLGTRSELVNGIPQDLLFLIEHGGVVITYDQETGREIGIAEAFNLQDLGMKGVIEALKELSDSTLRKVLLHYQNLFSYMHEQESPMIGIPIYPLIHYVHFVGVTEQKKDYGSKLLEQWGTQLIGRNGSVVILINTKHKASLSMCLGNGDVLGNGPAIVKIDTEIDPNQPHFRLVGNAGHRAYTTGIQEVELRDVYLPKIKGLLEEGYVGTQFVNRNGQGLLVFERRSPSF